MRTMKIALISFTTAGVMACSQTSSPGSAPDSSASSLSSVNKSSQSAVSFKLVDAPNRDLKSVVVNIDHMEVVLAGAGKAGRLSLAKDLGPVDLLTLQNGISLPLQDIVAPAGLQVQQIRLVLKDEGHYAVKSDDSICELKTPSAQKTGVKIILTNKVQFEAGNQYNIVVDFDANKSVVIQGNGGCLLKPVLKLKSAYKTPIADSGADSGSGSDSGSVSSGDSGSTTGDSGSTSGTTTSGGTDSSTGGEELVTTPDTNDSSTDGWDYTPVVDGSEPIVTTETLDTLL